MTDLRILIVWIFFICVILGANAHIDSLSYALGYETSIGLLAGENKLMRSEQDFREYIRGLEENMPELSLLEDSVFTVNYGVGTIQGIYLANSLEHTPDGKKPPLNCIIDGLRKVASDSHSLPNDTVDIMCQLKEMRDSVAFASMGDDEKCRFYTNYGIMKGFQSGLQELVNEAGSNGIKADYKYYASGIADMLELLNSTIASAYDMGRMIGLAFWIRLRDFPDISIRDYLLGAKAAFNLSEQLMSRDKVEELIQKIYDKPAVNVNEESAVPTAISIGEREIESSTQLDVDWNVAVYTVPYREECPKDVTDCFDKALRSIEDKFVSGETYGVRFSDMVRFFPNHSAQRDDVLKCVNTFNREIGDGYKMFCIRDLGGECTIGLVDMSHPFTAFVGSAFVEIIDGVHPIIDFSFRFGREDHTDKTAEWAAFTKASIGRTVVMQINGKPVMAPVINNEITGGACSITVSSSEEVEYLLKL